MENSNTLLVNKSCPFHSRIGISGYWVTMCPDQHDIYYITMHIQNHTVIYDQICQCKNCTTM